MILNVFGLKVPIKKKSNLTIDTGWSGYYDPIETIIYIDSEIKDGSQEYFQTLIHELFHCIVRRTGLLQTKMHEEVEEIICEQVAVAICENFNISHINEKKSKRNRKNT